MPAERIAIIGGGIIGIATARALVRERGADVVVFEKEDHLAAHQTGHNSGVVHAGLYYAPGTLKADLCARGRVALREFCADKRLPYREVGKLVVALDEAELAALARIEHRSIANAVPDLARVDSVGLTRIEPHAAGVAALHSPHTAVVDYSAITEAMADDVRGGGGSVLLSHEVDGLVRESSGVRVIAGEVESVFDRVISCAGLQSDVVAGFVGAPRSPRILPFRGEYWALDDARVDLVKGMIYPVPDPDFPFLGIHFTRSVYDRVHVGPNAVPALAREGYGWSDISLRDTWGSLTWPGALSLARQHWRMGAKEIAGSLIKSRYFNQARRFVPDLRIEDLTRKSGAGVRAQAWASDGSLLDDFAVDQLGAVTVVRNAPSPAATSSLAIADYLVEHHLS